MGVLQNSDAVSVGNSLAIAYNYVYFIYLYSVEFSVMFGYVVNNSWAYARFSILIDSIFSVLGEYREYTIYAILHLDATEI